jgi:hypothetical protein
VPPSRALSNKSGDQQARAELLASLLLSAGEKPYLLKHGQDRDAYYLVLVPISEEEAKPWAEKTKPPPVVLTLGALKLMPLQLEDGVSAGSIEPRLYDPAGGGWTATIAVRRFK